MNITGWPAPVSERTCLDCVYLEADSGGLYCNWFNKKIWGMSACHTGYTTKTVKKKPTRRIITGYIKFKDMMGS